MIAVDAETGKQRWLFDPFAGVPGTRRSVPNRGAAYWEGSSSTSCSGEAHRRDRRILYATLDGRLFELDSRYQSRRLGLPQLGRRHANQEGRHRSCSQPQSLLWDP